MRRLLALLTLLAGLPAAAQTGPVDASAVEPERAWVTLGLGAGAPYGDAFVGTATFGRTFVYQIGFQSTGDFDLVWGPGDNTSTFHVGAGLSRMKDGRRLAVTAGPAFVWGQRDLPEANDRSYYTGGVVVNGQALVGVFPRAGLGVGVAGFVNLNPVESACGVTASLVFGGFR